MASNNSARGTWRRRLATGLATGALATSGLVAGGVATAPAAHAATCTSYNYSYGGVSTCIRHIQSLLNYKAIYGVNRRVAVDGAFGAQTRAAVIEFQRYYRLATDGIVGPRTWRILCSPEMGPGRVPNFPYSAASAAGC